MNAEQKATKQLKIWDTIHKIYKKNNKQGWSMANSKKRPGITRITGIKFADSKHWQLKSKNCLYKINKNNYIEWYKNLMDSHVTRLGNFNFINAKQNNFISNTFPNTNKGTIFEIKYGDDCKKIFIKEMGFGNMNKCILPNANKKIIKNKDGGSNQVQFCCLAVFESVYIKIGELYLNFRRGSMEETQKLPDKVIDDERNQKNTFHFGVGYCKVRNDDNCIYSIIALSPEYINQTCVDIIGIGNKNININNIKINVKDLHTNYFLLLYPVYNNNIDGVNGPQFECDNKIDFDEDYDLQFNNNNNNNNYQEIINTPNDRQLFTPKYDIQTNNFTSGIPMSNYNNNNNNNVVSNNDMFDNVFYDYTDNNNNNNISLLHSPLTPIMRKEVSWKRKAKYIIENMEDNLNWDTQDKIIKFLESYQKKNNITIYSENISMLNGPTFFGHNTPYKPEQFKMKLPPPKRIKMDYNFIPTPFL